MMNTKTIPLAGPAEKVHTAMKLSVAVLFAALVVTMVTPGLADAAELGFLTPDSDIGFADTDGYVPIYTTCFPDNLGAFYSPYSYDGVTVEGSIIVNECALERLGAGPNDLERLLAHEMGHAMGLLHSDDPNDIMYPTQTITGT